MHICIITDGGAQLGMGHVQQSTTFANHLREHAEISFLTRSDERVAALIRDAGFDVTWFGSDDEIFDRLLARKPEIVLFDKIDVDERFAKRIKEQLRSVLVIFTNITGANRHADIAVTADIGSRFENVSYRDAETGTLTYFGPKFWVLRPEFYEYKRRGKTTAGEVRKILLMFGGSDPMNITSAAVLALMRQPRSYELDVIVGASFSHREELDRVLDTAPAAADFSIRVHQNVRNVAQLMYDADLVIASPGLGAFEALAVGTPVIVMPQDELQRETYEGFIRQLERRRADRLPGMIERREFTFPNEEHIQRMEIGEGVAELVDVIVRSAQNEA